MDEEMDAAIQRGQAVTERSHDELAGREELIVEITRRGRDISRKVFTAYLDDEAGVAQMITNSQQAILDAAVSSRG